MIGELLDRASRRARLADAVLKTDETTTLIIEAGRLKSSAYAQERGVNLRVVLDGRMGFSGSTADDAAAVVEAAFASARIGETARVDLPGPRPLPAVATHFPRAAAASVADLAQLGNFVLSRLSRDHCQVNVTVERSVGSVRVANTAGVDASYDVTTVSLSAELTRVRGDDVLIVADYLAGADLPAPADLEGLVEGMLQRVAWADRAAAPPSGAVPVCFTPGGAAVLLTPLKLALQGKSAIQGVSPLWERRDTPMFDAGFTLVDNPLLDGRSGSRPVDDEGVPSAMTPLIEQGSVRRFIYDLETAGRAGVAPSGHARRSTFGKPQAAYSNLMVEPGSLEFTELVAQIQDGLLVDELLGVGQGNVIGGAFSHPVALAYRVVNGEVTGRIKDAAIAGVVYDLLKRIAGLGKHVKWVGSTGVPPMVIDGVSVTGR